MGGSGQLEAPCNTVIAAVHYLHWRRGVCRGAQMLDSVVGAKAQLTGTEFLLLVAAPFAAGVSPFFFQPAGASPGPTLIRSLLPRSPQLPRMFRGRDVCVCV